MDLIRDVLEKQLVDPEERRMGKIDGLILEVEVGQPPRLAAIEQGAATLARRLHPRLATPFRLPPVRLSMRGLCDDVQRLRFVVPGLESKVRR
jgi:hypothetical protein